MKKLLESIIPECLMSLTIIGVTIIYILEKSSKKLLKGSL